MTEASSEARKATAAATSRGVPILPKGIAATMLLLFSSDHWADISVSMACGATALTVTP